MAARDLEDTSASVDLSSLTYYALNHVHPAELSGDVRVPGQTLHVFALYLDRDGRWFARGKLVPEHQRWCDTEWSARGIDTSGDQNDVLEVTALRAAEVLDRSGCGQACRSVLDAMTPVVSEVAEKPTNAGTRNPVTPDQAPTPGRKPVKEPKAIEIQAYRLYKIGGLDQTAVAKQLGAEHRIPYDQSKVSRAVKKVRVWLKAGNILPDLTAPKSKMTTMDPSKLEKGPRRDGRRGAH